MGISVHTGLGPTMKFFIIPTLIVAAHVIHVQGHGQEVNQENVEICLKDDVKCLFKEEGKSLQTAIRNEIENSLNSTKTDFHSRVAPALKRLNTMADEAKKAMGQATKAMGEAKKDREEKNNEAKKAMGEAKKDRQDKMDAAMRRIDETKSTCCTEYKFEPQYTGKEEPCPDCLSIRYTRTAISPTSQVKCVSNNNNGRMQDACRDMEHNTKLIREIRCNKCKYVVELDAETRQPQPPKLDMTTCQCRVTKGEMVKGQGPFKRYPVTSPFAREIVRKFGLEQRNDPKYRLMRNEDDTDKIKIVCETDMKGIPKTDDYSKCHVELTIEECPVKRDHNGMEKKDLITGKSVHDCKYATKKTSEQETLERILSELERLR